MGQGARYPRRCTIVSGAKFKTFRNAQTLQHLVQRAGEGHGTPTVHASIGVRTLLYEPRIVVLTRSKRGPRFEYLSEVNGNHTPMFPSQNTSRSDCDQTFPLDLPPHLSLQHNSTMASEPCTGFYSLPNHGDRDAAFNVHNDTGLLTFYDAVGSMGSPSKADFATTSRLGPGSEDQFSSFSSSWSEGLLTEQCLTQYPGESGMSDLPPKPPNTLQLPPSEEEFGGTPTPRVL